MRRWRRRARGGTSDTPSAAEPKDGGRIVVFAPSPILTITVESGPDRPEVHLHAGGQGFWVGRLAATLGADVVLCCALGGEPGRVLRGLIETEPLTLRAVEAEVPNGVYIHDRRSGERIEVVSVESRPLARHASDEKEEMVRDGQAANGTTSELLDAARTLREAGASTVLISRASEPAILVDDEPSAQLELAGPVFEALDHSGAGDSMFAATGVGLARGMDMLESLRLGMAAGALNATRRGLGTGTRQEIEHLARHVTVRPLSPPPHRAPSPPAGQA